MFPAALRRDILVLLAVKAVILTALYLLFFSPSHQPPPADALSHITGT